MVDSQKVFIVMIISIVVVLLLQIEVISKDRSALVKQAIEYGYAEKIIENDIIVFKWIIPATATAELK